MKKSLLSLFFFAFAISLLAASSLKAEELSIRVNSPDDRFPTPVCIPPNSCTLRGAINTANRFLQNPNNTASIEIDTLWVWLLPHDYITTSEDANLAGDLDINFSGENSRLVIFMAPRRSNIPVKNFNNSRSLDRIVDVIHGDVTFIGISIEDGKTAVGEGGGGIRIARGARVHLQGSAVKNCKSAVGGGILNYGTLIVDHSVILDNEVLRNDLSVEHLYPEVESRTEGIIDITDHAAYYLRGGGIANISGNVEVISSTIMGNKAGRAGGGFSNDQNGQASFTNSYIMQNKAFGVARLNDVGVLRTDHLYYPVGSGGGISNASGGRVLLDHSAVIDNSSFQVGAGVSNGLPASLTQPGVSGGVFEMRDSIFKNNKLPPVAEISDVTFESYLGPLFSNCNNTSIRSLGYNLYGDDNTCSVEGPRDRGFSEPAFEEALRYTSQGVPYYATHPRFSGIDNGSPSSPVTEDIRGVRRPLGGASDVGPYERVPTLDPAILEFVKEPFTGEYYPGLFKTQ